MSLIAYHGREADKSAILAELAKHREADNLVQGYGYWQDGKGCAVGCTIESDDHMLYESRFGIPVALARLEDAIFEGLPVDRARQWPERFMSAIKPGVDLSRVHWRLLHWLLTTPEVNPGIADPLVSTAIKQCADMIEILADGGAVTESAARSAARSAESAARSAASAARSAASAESAARSAASAAWSAESAASAASAASAESAAWSAAWSAASAARSEAWVQISDRLIYLIEICDK